MTLVGLDTMILIHATRRSKPGDPPELQDFRTRTLVLLDRLKSSGARGIVSTVALAELLKGLRSEHRGPVAAAVGSNFILRPVDVAVACFAADLWTKHRGLSEDKRLERKVLKVDVFVVAAARLAGAKLFYSNDGGCRALAAQAGLEAKDLPSHAENMFLDDEIRRGEAESGLEPE